jgi:hypothetical protein
VINPRICVDGHSQDKRRHDGSDQRGHVEDRGKYPFDIRGGCLGRLRSPAVRGRLGCKGRPILAFSPGRRDPRCNTSKTSVFQEYLQPVAMTFFLAAAADLGAWGSGKGGLP